ncbi:decaprenyl-diphosphate synthase subunit 1 [Tetranychus urticae]|uniref:All trans-polyprenyl-diphosphate synthase PDSS1 n=1 Tax=Tetranychus urticae TaxID=32264 RepID=T1K8J4_TETUR|nr:decaprenyl-diphosphate synthase subunit 1 [Tetranychus urticae]
MSHPLSKANLILSVSSYVLRRISCDQCRNYNCFLGAQNYGSFVKMAKNNFTSKYRHLYTSTCLPQATSAHQVSPSTSQQPSKDTVVEVDPFKLVEKDLSNLYENIRKELWTEKPELEEIASYYFDGQGKAFRPMIVVLVARALNHHFYRRSDLTESQKNVAMATEMIHTASLVHDDVIDTADIRRGKPSVNVLWGQKKAILAGDYILSRASQMLARLRNEEVIFVLSQVLLDLVQGEFMQLGSKEDDSERFSNYIHKSFKKTASLIAYTCKAVALLSGADKNFQEAAFQYGRNLGIAFQLVDDLLDFVSSQSELGKPATADLKLGLATAPVLFASEKFPELNVMIKRRFSEPNDVEKAYAAVMESDGLQHTRMLARQHADEALKFIEPFADSPEKQALIVLAEMTLARKK